MTPQFRVLGGSCPRHEETVETLFPVIFLGRAAENNVGPGGRVHDMRTMWSPYDQSCNLGGPASKKVWPEDRYNLDRHMQLHVVQQQKLVCTKSWCDTPFNTKFELINHVKDYKFFCHLCGKVIKKTGRDKGHLKLCSKRS